MNLALQFLKLLKIELYTVIAEGQCLPSQLKASKFPCIMFKLGLSEGTVNIP